MCRIARKWKSGKREEIRGQEVAGDPLSEKMSTEGAGWLKLAEREKKLIGGETGNSLGAELKRKGGVGQSVRIPLEWKVRTEGRCWSSMRQTSSEMCCCHF